ncbi:RNA polymerase sigma factor, cyanobacterial RpoD-like family [Synechococcus sp. PCC 7335]|uniref:RNA polymerase sigma factor, RpoD/SigA family n=1 Tax=Synechococcus sp. (strain ATCC 29403 / PCC 7335) TaxID=91464 RepID=UPI00017EBBF1|nr:RNA polymerase sigma factor, RpoD/SigA family [Synechococcus sp. PCC 7335]EDX84024.1 RNA polymerase sigma factor, cyanobacterial RpoD-like family [Synechococcus sp. PCC 7335]
MAKDTEKIKATQGVDNMQLQHATSTLAVQEKSMTDVKQTATKVKRTTKAKKTTTKKAATKKSTSTKTKPVYTTDAVRSYLHEIGRVPLLSHEDEIVLGKQVQKMMALLAIKEELAAKLSEAEGEEAEVSNADWAAAASIPESELDHHMRRGQRSKRKMIEANLRLVVAVAKKYQKRNLEFLDLIQEGTLGLERGVEKFDPMKGYKFSTYAYWWIRQAITRAIAQQARTIRLPIHITEKLNKIKRVQRELSQKLGRSPNAAEIGQELELEPKQVREYLSIARQPISLDVRIGDNQDTELQDLLEDDGASPEDYTVQQSLRSDIFRMLSELTSQQQEVINLRFGLADGNPLSLAKVGQRMGISRERVRQLEQQALKHLRRRKASINGYLAAG